MWADFAQLVPPDVVGLALTLALALLLGVEREQHKAAGAHYLFGGIRTFPLIGLVGYAFALLSGAQVLPIAIGFAGVAALMAISYRHKLQQDETAGMTTEISALETYLVGALICRGHAWIAGAIVITSVLLLELKAALDKLASRVAPEEISAFATFLMLTVVILPIVPNRSFTPFALNPFKTWLAVVAVCGISYGSYVISKLLRGRGGVLLSAILGGAYSSTITTVALARRSVQEGRPHLFSGAILTASALMYFRLAVLLALFNRALFARLAISFAVLGAVGLAGGWLWSRRPDPASTVTEGAQPHRNPLEIRAALLFAVVFVASLVATEWVGARLGRGAVIALGGILGVADVDPFILGVSQNAGAATPLGVGAQAIAVAAASNNLAKGVYALVFADRATGRAALGLLAVLALAGLIPLIWIG